MNHVFLKKYRGWAISVSNSGEFRGDKPETYISYSTKTLDDLIRYINSEVRKPIKKGLSKKTIVKISNEEDISHVELKDEALSMWSVVGKTGTYFSASRLYIIDPSLLSKIEKRRAEITKAKQALKKLILEIKNHPDTINLRDYLHDSKIPESDLETASKYHARESQVEQNV